MRFKRRGKNGFRQRPGDNNPVGHGFSYRHKKHLGQCFLAAPEILEQTAELLPISGKTVLEIGAGDGRLTQELAEKVGKNGKVVAVELDDDLVAMLGQKFGGNKREEIVRADALELDFSPYPLIFGNLPYYISTPLLLKTLASSFSHAVYMLQAEVGERLLATPGTKQYSRLTLALQSKAVAEIVEYVPKECFDPVPKVDSVLVHITPKPRAQQLELDSSIVNALFQHPNQKIRKALRHSYSTLGRQKAEKLLREIPPGVLEKSARNASAEEFAEISRLAETTG
jgi:16S rRNA (adenine1518-N6/adenine1519-N6)-dimethyltransferase